MQWVWTSIVLSVLLTVVANVAIRLFPRHPRRTADPTADPSRRWGAASGRPGPPPGWDDDEPRIRVVAPWKVMIVLSVVATLVLNVALNLILAASR